MKRKLTLDADTLRVDSFRPVDANAVERGTVHAHLGPSAQCPTARCTELYDGYTCPFTCQYTCI